MSKERVLVAMSGGVDSSVTSAILLQRGFEVIGVTMRLGLQDDIDQSSAKCCSIESVESARRVADQLDIPFYAVNFQDIFRQEIVDYFCDEYSAGRTPNPCIICNQKLKFGELIRLANQLEAQYIATGHYARISYEQRTGRYILRKGIDDRKDQSYALFSLTQAQLKRALTPLGDYTKTEVRIIAEKLSLKVSQRPESQELCFIPDNDYNRFLHEQIPDRIQPGLILDTAGNVVGRHDGIQFYTIGQRKGLGDSLGKAMYVVRIDPSKNAVIIGDKDDLLVNGLSASGANFISISELTEPLKVTARIRYNHSGSKGTVYPLSDDRFEVVFDEPCMAVTPGQAVVLYDDDIVIGGGWIESGLPET